MNKIERGDNANYKNAIMSFSGGPRYVNEYSTLKSLETLCDVEVRTWDNGRFTSYYLLSHSSTHSIMLGLRLKVREDCRKGILRRWRHRRLLE